MIISLVNVSKDNTYKIKIILLICLYVILRGLYAFIVTDFIFCWAIALLLIFQHIRRQARTVVRAFFRIG